MDDKQTLLVIGAGRLQIPAIERAREMGLFTVATDYNPDAHGLTLADDRLIISTRDVDGSVRIARDYHRRKRPIDGVITVGTDASMAVAAVANNLGLPGIRFSDAEAASNKLKMRARLKEHGVPCPDYYECWTEADALGNHRRLGGGPVVVKPADNMGARGVSLADTPEKVKAAFQFAKEATPSGEVVIEEYMEGAELSIDALVHDGTIRICGIADRLIAYPPYFVETGHIMPSNQPEAALADAVRVMEAGMRALGLSLGAAKGDIKLTPRGAMVGEIAARLSGGFMSAFTYPYSSGVDLIGNAIRIALGKAPDDLCPRCTRVSMEAAIIPPPGTVKAIRRIDEVLSIPGIRHLFLNVDIGDTVVVPRSNVEKAGHLIAVADDREQVRDCIERALATLEIETG